MHLRCHSCANTGKFEFTQDKRWAICLYCGTYIDPNEGKIMLSLDEENAQRLPALRKALRDAFDDGYYDRCEQIATDILELLPNNFLAAFYRHLSHKMSGDPRAYEIFLENLPEPPAPEDAREAFERALEKLELREFECVSRFIVKSFNPIDQRERARALVERYELAKKEFEDYAERPRDVFICFSARDTLIAERIVKEIENEGYSCYIYTRNMPPDAPRYDERLKYAIDNARAFLVITSKDSLRSMEVAKEMRIARDNAHIKRIEYKIDESPRTILFRQFFEGIQFVDGTQADAVALELLIMRVHMELESASKPIFEPKPQQAFTPTPDISTRSLDIAETVLTRAFICIEDGEFEEAKPFIETYLNTNPKGARGYLARVLCEYRLKDEEALKTCEKPYWEDVNFTRAKRFADADTCARLDNFAEYARLYTHYLQAQANPSQDLLAHIYADLAARFDALAAVIPEAAERADNCRVYEREALYAAADKMAQAAVTEQEHEAAAKAFDEIAHIKDARERAQKCRARCAELKEYKKHMINQPLINHLQSLFALKKRSINVAEYIYAQGYEHELERYWQLRRECEGAGASLALYESRAIGLRDGRIVDTYGFSESGKEILCGWKNIVSTAISSDGVFGLCKDGRLYAAGTDRYKSVPKWTDIVALTAGYIHVAGLRKDGTVVAIGYYHGKQCNTDELNDIVTVASGESHTVGIRADGTVSAVGRNDEGQCNTGDWRDIVAVDASVHHTVGVRSDGTVKIVGYNPNIECDVGDWKDIVAIKSGRCITAGLRSNGTVVATNRDVHFQDMIGFWSNIVSIAAGNRHIVGLTRNGKVVAAGNNNVGQCDTYSWTDIIAIAAYESMTVGLRRDGKLLVAGK